MINLKKLQRMLDEALESETKETLEEFFNQIYNKNGNDRTTNTENKGSNA